MFVLAKIGKTLAATVTAVALAKPITIEVLPAGWLPDWLSSAGSPGFLSYTGFGE